MSVCSHRLRLASVTFLSICSFVSLRETKPTPALALAGEGGARTLGLLAWAGMAASFLPTLRRYDASPAWAPLLPLIERMMANLSIILASNGKCSQISMPGTFVLIGLNSPRMPSGAVGFMSHISR